MRFSYFRLDYCMSLKQYPLKQTIELEKKKWGGGRMKIQ